MSPEEKARQQIDAMFTASGWVVQTKDKINLSAARGVAIGELSFKTGEPDYTLFVDGKAIDTTEAKPASTRSPASRNNPPSMSPASRSAFRRGKHRSRSVTRAQARKHSSPTASIPSRAAGACSHFIARKPCSLGCSRKNNWPSASGNCHRLRKARSGLRKYRPSPAWKSRLPLAFSAR